MNLLLKCYLLILEAPLSVKNELLNLISDSEIEIPGDKSDDYFS